MPTVPRYQPQVRPTPVQPTLEDTRRDPRAFGAGEAAAMARTGQAASQIAAQEAAEARRRRIQALAMEADLKAAEQVDRLLRDPERGLYRRQGLDAQDALGSLPEELDKIQSEIASGLEGDARAMFDRAFARRQQSVAQDYRGYAMRQQESWERGIRGAQVERAVQDVTAAPFSETAKEALEHGRMALEVNLQGQSEDVIRQARTAFLTQAHGGGLDTLLRNGDLAGAKQYLGQYGDEMDPGARSQYQERIRNMTDLVDAQEFAEDRLDVYRPGTSAEVALHLDAALRDARDRYEGPQQEQVLQQVRARFAQEAEALRAQEAMEAREYARRIAGQDVVTQREILSTAPPPVQEALSPSVEQRAAAALAPDGRMPDDQTQQIKVGILDMIEHGAFGNREEVVIAAQGLPTAMQNQLLARFDSPEAHVRLSDVQESLLRRGVFSRRVSATDRARRSDPYMRQVEAHLKPGEAPTPQVVDRIIGVLLSDGTIQVPGERERGATYLEAREAGEGRWFRPAATEEALDAGTRVVFDMRQRLGALDRGEGDWLAPGNADLRAFAHGLGVRDEDLTSGDPQAWDVVRTQLHFLQHDTPEVFFRQKQGLPPLGVSVEEQRQIGRDLARSRFEQVLESRAAEARMAVADARLADIVSGLRFHGTDAPGAGAEAARAFVEYGASFNDPPQWLRDAMDVYGVDFEDARRGADSLSEADRRAYWLNIADTLLSRLPGAE